MDEKIKKELINLETELTNLKNFADQIDEVKNLSKETVNAIVEIQKKVSQHLEVIFSYYEKNLNQSKLIFAENVENLKDSGEEVISAQKDTLEKTIKLVELNTSLVEKIEKVDFPSRLDKIDVSVSSINQSNLNILMKLENMEKSIKEDNDRKIEKINENFKKQSKSIKYIIMGLIVIFIVNLVILILK